MNKAILFAGAALLAGWQLTAGELIRPELQVGLGKPAAAHELLVKAKNEEYFNRYPVEGGKISAFRTDKELVFQLELTDSDVVSESKADQRIEGTGDMVCIILKQTDKNPAWNISVSPNGHCRCCYYAGIGLMKLTPEVLQVKPAVKTAAANGKWILELRLPLEIFTGKGVQFNAPEQWLGIVLRTNYSGKLDFIERSGYPQPWGDEANTAAMAKIRFVK